MSRLSGETASQRLPACAAPWQAARREALHERAQQCLPKPIEAKAPSRCAVANDSARHGPGEHATVDDCERSGLKRVRAILHATLHHKFTVLASSGHNNELHPARMGGC